MSINIGTVKHIPKETRYTFLQVRGQAIRKSKSYAVLHVWTLS